MEFNGRTMGTVTEVKTIWWIKVNTKPIRKHALDGARFPHSISVNYTVGGVEFTKRAYVPWKISPPSKGAEVEVYYNEDKPSKSKIDIKGELK